jgi:hypothetical protein
MEEISTSYDDKAIRKWAKDIRKIKIRELNEMIKSHKESLKSAPEYYNPERYKTIIQAEIDKLKSKVEILKRK